MRLKLGVRAKLTLVLVTCAAALLAATVARAYSRGRAALEVASMAELASTASEKEGALRAWIETRRAALGALAASPALATQVAALLDEPGADGGGRLARQQLLGELAVRMGPEQGYLALLVIEPHEGRVVLATDPRDEETFKEDRPYFLDGRLGPVVQGPYHSLAQQGQAMTAAAPVRDADGRLLAVLAGRLDLNQLDAIVGRRAGLHATDEAFLVDAAGLFVTRPRLAANPAAAQGAVPTTAVRRCLAGGSGTVLDAEYRDAPAVVAFRWWDERSLCLIVEMDQAEALQPVELFGRALLLGGGLTLAAAVAVAFAVAQPVTRPLRALQAAAAVWSSGDWAHRAGVRGTDEVGQLGQAFDDMAAQLERSTAEREQQREALRAANAELERFAYTISHDLKAPLTSIQGFAQVLAEDYGAILDEDGRDYLRRIGDNAQELGRLINDVLALSRIGRGAVPRERLAAGAAVRRAVDGLRAEIDRRQARVDVSPELPAVLANPTLVEQALTNLLANALTYGALPGEPPRVEIGAADAGPRWRLWVRDHGPGIPADQQARIFHLFERLPAGRAANPAGTGLGLAIVARAAEAVGGAAGVHSAIGQGATFWIELPKDAAGVRPYAAPRAATQAA